MIKKSSSKNTILEESSSKMDDLGMCMSQILDYLTVNPTLNYAIKKSGRDKRLVSKDINKLIKRGYLERIDRGVYKVILKDPKYSTKSSSILEKTDTIEQARLHNIEVKLRLSHATFAKMKNWIFAMEKHIELHPLNSASGSYYFNLEIKGLVTNQNIFLVFPADFEIVKQTEAQCYAELDEIIKKILLKWQSIFKMMLYKTDRQNYEITNQHLEIKNSPIAEGISKEAGQKVSVHDDDDGKTALMIDTSKSTFNIESPHATKAPDYIALARTHLNRIKSGQFDKWAIEHEDLKQVIMRFDRLINIRDEPQPPEQPEDKPLDKKDKPFYVG